jgi:hypothetical protein
MTVLMKLAFMQLAVAWVNAGLFLIPGPWQWISAVGAPVAAFGAIHAVWLDRRIERRRREDAAQRERLFREMVEAVWRRELWARERRAALERAVGRRAFF